MTPMSVLEYICNNPVVVLVQLIDVLIWETIRSLARYDIICTQLFAADEESNARSSNKKSHSVLYWNLYAFGPVKPGKLRM